MEKEIGKLPKNENTDIVIRVDDFGGKKGLTIREYVTGDRYTGFTKSGVRISTENFPAFKEMINSVTEEDMKQEESEEPSEKLPPEQETLDETIKEAETEVELAEEEAEGKIKVEKPGKEELPDY